MQNLLEHLPSLWVLVAGFVIVVAAAIIQAGLGMGFGLMAAPLLALIAPEMVPVPVLWIGFVTSVFAGWGEREGVIWPEVWLGAVGRILGVIAALAVLSTISRGPEFSIIFGLMVGCAVLLSLSGWRLPFNRVTLLAMSTLSGVMGTITSVGAPPLAMIYQGRRPSVARPTLGTFFAVGGAISLIGLHLAGLAGLREVFLAALMVPPMLLGTMIGRGIKMQFDSSYRSYMLVIAGTAAVLLILRGLAG